jgi:hypothetical protein
MVKANRRLLRLPEARDYLNGAVKLSTLRQWVWLRKVEAIRVGKSVCIAQDTLDRIVQEGTLPALKLKRGKR